jgi:hypothetical protein
VARAPSPACLNLKKAAINIAAFSISTTHVVAEPVLSEVEGCPTCPAEQSSATDCWSMLDTVDKKEIESPKLTARFLIWITGFMIVVFALIAHFVWRVF